MNSIATVVGCVEQVRVTRAAHHLVEVEHRVEASALANPIVDLVLDLGLGLVPARVAWFRRAIVPRYDRRAGDLDALGLHARDDRAQSAHDLGPGRLAPDAVRAHEQEYLTHAGVRT